MRRPSLRLRIEQGGDSVVASTLRAVREASLDGQVRHVESADRETLQLLQRHWRDDLGRDWRVLVLMPRSEFSSDIDASMRNDVLITLATAAALLGVGLLVQGLIQRELRQLSGAVARIARGECSEPLHSDHPDEQGALARDVGALQRRLHTDQLTGLANGSAVMAWLERRVPSPRRRSDQLIRCGVRRSQRLHAHQRQPWPRCRRRGAARSGAARAGGCAPARPCGTPGRRRAPHRFRQPGQPRRRRGRACLESCLREPLKTLALLEPEAPCNRGSCGMALFPDDAKTVDELLRRADADRHARKRAGPTPLPRA